MAKAASCHAMTILVISLPEKPLVFCAMSSTTSLVTLSVDISFLVKIRLRGYLMAKSSFSEKVAGGEQY